MRGVFVGGLPIKKRADHTPAFEWVEVVVLDPSGLRDFAHGAMACHCRCEQ